MRQKEDYWKSLAELERLLKREGNLFTVIHTMSKASKVYSLLRSTNSANCRQLPDYLDN